jgi:hypothetical protein
VQLEVGEVRQPHERRQVIADAEVDRLAAQLDRLRPDPVGPVRGALLLVEVAPLDPVRIALQSERAVAKMGQHGGSDPRVVLDDLPLREAHAGVQHLVEVGE